MHLDTEIPSFMFLLNQFYTKTQNSNMRYLNCCILIGQGPFLVTMMGEKWDIFLVT